MQSDRSNSLMRACGLTAVLTIAALGATVADAVPRCYNGEFIWDNGLEVGCRHSLSTWNAGLTPGCNSEGLLPPNGGDCVVCVDPSYRDTILNGGALTVGRVTSPPRLFHCLTNPGYERYLHGACSETFWYWVVAWWPMDEGTGSATFDAVFENHGTLFGASRAPGWIEGGLHFDGVNDYVEIPDSYELDVGTGDFSIDAWIKTDQSSGVQSILDKRVSSPYRGWHLYLYNGKLGLQLADGAATNYTSTVHLADGQWHHIAVTVDRDATDGIKFYEDGVLSPTTRNPTGRQGSLASSSPLRIGRRTAGAGGYWRGTLDELAVHLGVLPQTTIDELADRQARGKCD